LGELTLDTWLDLRGPTSKHCVLREGTQGRKGEKGRRREKAGGKVGEGKERRGTGHMHRSSVNFGRGQDVYPENICMKIFLNA